jgi:hypothetical protein
LSSLQIDAGTDVKQTMHLSVADVVVVSVPTIVYPTRASATSFIQAMDLSINSTTSNVTNTNARLQMVLCSCKKVLKHGFTRQNPDDLKAFLLTSYKSNLPKVRLLTIPKQSLDSVKTPTKVL